MILAGDFLKCFLMFSRKISLALHANSNGLPLETIYMKFQSLFSGALRKHAYSNRKIFHQKMKKKKKKKKKKSYIFHISAQGIGCGYSLEPPRRGGSKSTHNLCF